MTNYLMITGKITHVLAMEITIADVITVVMGWKLLNILLRPSQNGAGPSSVDVTQTSKPDVNATTSATVGDNMASQNGAAASPSHVDVVQTSKPDVSAATSVTVGDNMDHAAGTTPTSNEESETAADTISEANQLIQSTKSITQVLLENPVNVEVTQTSKPDVSGATSVTVDDNMASKNGAAASRSNVKVTQASEMDVSGATSVTVGGNIGSQNDPAATPSNVEGTQTSETGVNIATSITVGDNT
ncbi:unnamed protein product, partial [Didymodactylos carnosus]